MALSSFFSRAVPLIVISSLLIALSGQFKISTNFAPNKSIGETFALIASTSPIDEGHIGLSNHSIQTVFPIANDSIAEVVLNDNSSSNAVVIEKMRNQTADDELFNELVHAFPIWNHSAPHSWCHDKEGGRASGLLFVKVNKCASSTGMGVALRIADTLSQRVLAKPGNVTTKTTPCFTRYRHAFAWADELKYLFRRKERSILWSIVRHPAPRVLSAYFFYEASRNDKNATEEAILEYAKHPQFQMHAVNYLRLKKMFSRDREIKLIMQNYDFIAVSERMDESIVVLSILLKLPLADMVVLASKQAGGYDDGRSSKGCVKLKKKWSTPVVDEYLYGDFLANNSDFLLYKIVNASLDKTIQALGVERVAAGVERYRMLSKKNDEECRTQAFFPCPMFPGEDVKKRPSRWREDCYFSDAGCGHKCTDRALRTESDEEWKALQFSTDRRL